MLQGGKSLNEILSIANCSKSKYQPNGAKITLISLYNIPLLACLRRHCQFAIFLSDLASEGCEYLIDDKLFVPMKC
jgi:hypothetical protein